MVNRVVILKYTSHIWKYILSNDSLNFLSMNAILPVSTAKDWPEAICFGQLVALIDSPRYPYIYVLK